MRRVAHTMGWSGCLLCTALGGAAQADDAPKSWPAEVAMAQRVDDHLAAGWRQAGIEPVPAADDSEFHRRAWLDLVGTIPAVADTRGFLADTRPDKRERLIDRLTSSPRFARHLAAVWRRVLVPDVENVTDPAEVSRFENWLFDQFSAGRRYDNIVGDLLTADGRSGNGPPVLFFTSRQLMPEDLATATARVFLGRQIDCAQCHQHPFDHWGQRDFWDFATFFARLRPAPGRGGRVTLVETREDQLQLPPEVPSVSPRFLDGTVPPARKEEDRRRELTIWLVGRDNPYFAEATVNRVWAQLFGWGLVHPVDDFGDHNPPSHPELLQELAQFFVGAEYDLPQVYRALALSHGYQLASDRRIRSAVQATGQAAGQGGADQERTPPVDDPRLFAQMALRPLAAEQVYDALAQLSSRPATATDAARVAFVAQYQVPTATAGEFQAGLPQTLLVMNGALVSTTTDPTQGRLLVSLTAPWLDNQDRVEALFLAALGRFPQQAEQAQMTRFLAEATSGGANGSATADTAGTAPLPILADALWALVNSSEFLINH